MSIAKFSLFKRYNGHYYIIYEHDGKTKWKSTKKKLKHEALAVLSDFKEYLRKDVPKTKFSDFKQQFLTLQSNNLRSSTIERIYLPAFNSFERICGNKHLAAYSLRDIEHFKSVRLLVCSPTTVNIQFRTLRAAFNHAVDWQLLYQNPFLKTSQLTAPEQLPSYLTKEQFKKLLGVVEEKELKDLIVFATLTGMRLGEIVNLRWADIDLERKLVQVSNSKTFKTKTGKMRTLPLNLLVVDLLRQKALLTQITEYVFQRNGLRIAEGYISHTFKKFVRLSGLPEAIHFHTLRHTFATWLVQEGVNIYEVQKLLGHSDITTTQIYSHLASNELHHTINKISYGLN
jgi:site-specific recombinase XerD